MPHTPGVIETEPDPQRDEGQEVRGDLGPAGGHTPPFGDLWGNTYTSPHTRLRSDPSLEPRRSQTPDPFPAGTTTPKQGRDPPPLTGLADTPVRPCRSHWMSIPVKPGTHSAGPAGPPLHPWTWPVSCRNPSLSGMDFTVFLVTSCLLPDPPRISACIQFSSCQNLLSYKNLLDFFLPLAFM